MHRLKLHSVGALVRPTTRDAPRIDAIGVALQFGVGALAIATAFCHVALWLWQSLVLRRPFELDWQASITFGAVCGLAVFGALLMRLLWVDVRRADDEHNAAMTHMQTLIALERKEREARLPARQPTPRYIAVHQPTAHTAIDDEYLAETLPRQTVDGKTGATSADLLDFTKRGYVLGKFSRAELVDAMTPRIVLPSGAELTRGMYDKCVTRLLALGIVERTNDNRTVPKLELGEALAVLSGDNRLPSPIETVGE